MLQFSKSLFYRVYYIILRFISKLSMLYVKRFSDGERLLSDSQKTNYELTIDKLLKNEFSFDRFRRIFGFCEIVENVTYSQGFLYISRINHLAHGKSIPRIGDLNDNVGNPIRYNYPGFGRISPTTLRYISVALEIQNIFGPNLSGDFVEIGGGYGGQVSVLKDLFRINNYGVYDLPNVQTLIRSYLKSINKDVHVQYLNLENDENREWDLAISNYAFSELPKNLQVTYIDKVLSNSRRGYLIMNSGRENLTTRSEGKLSLEALQKLLPSSEIFEEIPKTGPDNYVIIWGHKK